MTEFHEPTKIPTRTSNVSWDEFLAAEQATRAAAGAAGRWLDIYRRAAGETVSGAVLDELLREALSAMAHLLGADAVSLLLASDDGSRLIARAAWGLNQEIDLALSIPAGEGVSGPILATGEPRLIDDLEKEHVIGTVLRTSGHRSFAGVPLKSGDRTLGVLHATRREIAPFGREDLELLDRFAEPIAAAIERVRLFEGERTARVLAERATERLRSLQHITAALASTAAVQEVCEIIIHEMALLAEGGERAIWMLNDDHLVLVAGAGDSSKFPEIPLDAPLPAGNILRDGQPLFVETRAELAERWPSLANVATLSFAGLPLIAEHQRLGVLAVGYRTEHHFDSEEREYLTAIAEQAASALQRAVDRAALEAARRTAEDRGTQLDFLSEASERLSRSLDLDVTLRTVAQLAVPRLTDRCVLYILEDNAIAKHVLAPALSDDERHLFEGTRPTLSAPSGAGAVIRTGVAEYVPDVDDAVLVSTATSPAQLDLLRRVGFGGVLILPLRARNRTLGALALANRRGRRLEETERDLATELAARAAMTIDNALIYQRESHVARRLIESLLPSDIPDIEGLDIGVRFESGSMGLEIGGDFYDVIPTGDSSWLVLVGDVQGKGVEAAAVTGLARHTVRAAAEFETRPAELLQRLNHAMISNILQSHHDGHPWDVARLCTAALFRFDRSDAGWLVTGCSAGHPLPLLFTGDAPAESVGRSNILLGVVEDANYEEASFLVVPGSCLVLYTDGVVERSDTSSSGGIERVVKVARDSGSTATKVADAVITAALGEEGVPTDDMLVLVIETTS